MQSTSMIKVALEEHQECLIPRWTGREFQESDKETVIINGGVLEQWRTSPTLYGLLVSSSGRIDVGVDKRIAQGIRDLWWAKEGCFPWQEPISLVRKRKIYNASSLLYRAECWTPLNRHKKLTTFHHRCTQNILRVYSRQHWMNHTTMAEVRRSWAD